MSSANTYVSLDEHKDFFERAARDDQFRQQLQARPAEVLASFGIAVADESLPQHVDLPGKETFQSGLQASNKVPKIVPKWAGIFSDLDDMAEN